MAGAAGIGCTGWAPTDTRCGPGTWAPVHDKPFVFGSDNGDIACHALTLESSVGSDTTLSYRFSIEDIHYSTDDSVSV